MIKTLLYGFSKRKLTVEARDKLNRTPIFDVDVKVTGVFGKEYARGKTGESGNLEVNVPTGIKKIICSKEHYVIATEFLYKLTGDTRRTVEMAPKGRVNGHIRLQSSCKICGSW